MATCERYFFRGVPSCFCAGALLSRGALLVCSFVRLSVNHVSWRRRFRAALLVGEQVAVGGRQVVRRVSRFQTVPRA